MFWVRRLVFGDGEFGSEWKEVFRFESGEQFLKPDDWTNLFRRSKIPVQGHEISHSDLAKLRVVGRWSLESLPSSIFVGDQSFEVEKEQLDSILKGLFEIYSSLCPEAEVGGWDKFLDGGCFFPSILAREAEGAWLGTQIADQLGKMKISPESYEKVLVKNLGGWESLEKVRAAVDCEYVIQAGEITSKYVLGIVRIDEMIVVSWGDWKRYYLGCRDLLLGFGLSVAFVAFHEGCEIYSYEGARLSSFNAKDLVYVFGEVAEELGKLSAVLDFGPEVYLRGRRMGAFKRLLVIDGSANLGLKEDEILRNLVFSRKTKRLKVVDLHYMVSRRGSTVEIFQGLLNSHGDWSSLERFWFSYERMKRVLA